eukprot:COSAG02_NODE_10307_length_1974_cov_1.388800_1_plen_123_part_00
MDSHTISRRPSSQDGGSLDGQLAPSTGQVASIGQVSFGGSRGVQVELHISVSLTLAMIAINPPTPKLNISITASVQTTFFGNIAGRLYTQSGALARAKLCVLRASLAAGTRGAGPPRVVAMQ